MAKKTTKPTAPKFLAGDRVKLLPFEDQPEELGVVIEYEGNNLYCVTVDRRFRLECDDGLREVDGDQLEASSEPLEPVKTKITTLFRISARAAQKLFKKEFKEAMVDLDDVDPRDIDWFIDSKGNLWTNDALDDHGYTFFNLATPTLSFDRSEVKVLDDLND